MGHKFFNCYGSHLRRSFDEHNVISEDDELDTLNETEISVVFDETVEKTKPSYSKLLSSLMTLNTKELYEVILHEIIHYVGLDMDNLCRISLIKFAQKAFKIDQKNHDDIHKSVKEKKPPKFILNIEIINGKKMKAKDSNGLSDPFCALYLSSDTNSKYYTSIKFKTLEPVWEEYFSLPVENPATDELNVQVWDFDPVETVKQKVTTVKQIKGLKGTGKYFKEIIECATHCKRNKELIGSTKIPLRTLNFSNLKCWYNVTHKNRLTGSVLMKLSFGTSKDKQVSVQEYRHLLRILLTYQIGEEKIEMYSWMGDLLPHSSLILRQHVKHKSISPVEQYLSQWIEYINIHLLDPVINSKVFSDLMDNLMKPITSGLLSEDELKMFWQSTKKILPLWYNNIRTIRQRPVENDINKIENILNILKNLQSLNLPKDLDLFAPDIYGWLLPCENTRDIRCTLHDAIFQGALDWYKHVFANHPLQDFTEKEKMKRQLIVIKLLKLDVQKAIQLYDEMFDKKIQLPYSNTIFSIYGDKLTDFCEPFITKICEEMETINFEAANETDNNPLSTGMTLFELYMGIQEFTKLKNNFYETKLRDSPLFKYHLWFKQGVIRWFEIAVYKTNVCIERAVRLDKLDRVHPTVKYSSSVVDTLEIFNQINNFWQQLAWPDGSCSFIATIIDDICKCSLYYSNEMSKKVCHNMEKNKVLKSTKELCLAVNNINHIKYYVDLLPNSWSLSKMMESLTNHMSDVEIDCCKKNLNLVIEQAVNSMNKTTEKLLVQIVENKLIPEIRHVLIKCETMVHDLNDTHLQSLMQYLYENISMIHEEFNVENFQFIHDMIVEQIVILAYELVKINTKKKKTLPYFKRLRCTIQELFEFLKNENETNHNSEIIRELEELLYLHALDTEDLIHEHYLKRFQEQKELTEANEGVLTVKLMFCDNVLIVEILNAHRLRQMDSNGFSDPFVTVCLLPQYKFIGVTCPKTAVHKKNLSPIFDASFKIPLTPEQRGLSNGMVMFKIQDEDFMGFRNEYISEAFVHFKDIPFGHVDTDLNHLHQTKLLMSVPKTLDSKELDVIRSRSSDDLAKYFIQQIKIKITSSKRKYNK